MRNRIVLLLVLLAAALTAAGAEIRVVDTRILTQQDLPPVERATHELSVHLYRFQKTRWTEAQIVSATMQVSQLLAPCAVALAQAELRVLDTDRGFHFYWTPVSRELLRALKPAKPAVFFVEDTRNRPAFDAEAIGRANAATRPELADTIWVAYGARDLPYALAHELVHVLTDSGEHSDQPGNLMRTETSPQNATLTAFQCERLRTRGQAHGLLAPRP
ncbi:MAG TPA: hypothetical protein VM164_06300 [Burkholderiales bacterium]|nr:hypothetical protein [Burkholderiales bacterium]